MFPKNIAEIIVNYNCIVDWIDVTRLNWVRLNKLLYIIYFTRDNNPDIMNWYRARLTTDVVTFIKNNPDETNWEIVSENFAIFKSAEENGAIMKLLIE